MREDVFAALAPLCPRCLHHAGEAVPLTIAERYEMRGAHIWHGTLHCTNPSCWMEFPILDGVPLIVPDPRSVLANQQHHVLWRQDLPDAMRGILGDAFGPGDAYDTLRYHLSLYGGDHYAGWGIDGESGVAALLDWGLTALASGAPLAAPCLDLGGSVGRGGWELAQQVGGPTLVGDLNLSMLRFGQALALEGRIRLDLRRVGIVYDTVVLEIPEAAAAHAPDFWGVDASALPFTADRFGLVSGINLVDCTAAPTNVISEVVRVVRPGGGVVLATPHDWSAQATEMPQWLGGHSQRGAHGGAPEPVLLATLAQFGVADLVEAHDLTWRLRLHARSTMEYSVHAIAGRATATPAG